MAWLQKKLTTVYLDGQGSRVPKGTPGAEKKQIESDKWYGCWKEGGRKVMVPLATDKQAAQVMLTDLIRQKERGEARLINPFKEHLERPLVGHVKDYLAEVRSTTSSEDHQNEVARILGVFMRDSGAVILKDVTADRVSTYLSKLKSGPTTRNMHRRILGTFLNWLEGVKRIERNPITRLSVRVAKKGKERQRRALNAEEIQALLQAALDYPLRSASVNRGGRNAKKKPAERPAKLKPATVARLQQRGRERWLMYRLAVLTGLRRAELSRLRVAHFDLDRQPFAQINFPGHLAKNHKPARILLVPSLAADLGQWVADTNKRPGDLLLSVPSRSNLAKLHKAHLALAGIPYADAEGRYADFHSLRKAANVLLRKAGIPPKERQLFLRHGKLELTTETYDDELATVIHDVVKALANTKL
jgi:integrase